jgi:HK97 family phage portal protein
MARREFLPALRRALSRPETKGLPERVRASSSGYLIPGIPHRSTGWDVKRAVEEGYEANTTVFRCVELICTQAVKQPIVLFKDGTEKTGKKIDDPLRDPTNLVSLFNRQANPWEVSKIFRHRLVAQFLLNVKKGVFVEVIRTRSGRIGLLNLLDPDLVTAIPDETDPMGSFEVRTPNSSTEAVNYLPRFDPRADAVSQPASILWLRSPHPLVSWQGMSPIEPAGLDIDLEKFARLYNRRFLQNDGRPGGLLSVKGNVSPDIMELIQAQFTGGVESAGRTTVISADAVSYADTSGSPRDLMWGDLAKASKEDICTAFGVPPSLIFGAGGETFDNADADYASFWEHREESLIGLVDAQLDILTGGYDDDLLLRHDLSEVWVLGRHRREQEDRDAADLDRGAISYNEYRERRGLEPVKSPAADVLWIPAAGKMAVAQDKDIAQQAVEQPVATALPAPAPPGELPPGGQEPPPGQRQIGPGAEDPGGNAGLRLVGKNPRTEDGEPEDLERADLLGGRNGDMEGKQRSPRSAGSGLPGAGWR